MPEPEAASASAPTGAAAAGELVPQAAPASMREGLTRVWTYRHLVRNLVTQQLELRYRGSVVAAGWTFIVPLMMVVVYATAFSRVIDVGTPRLGLYLVIGLLTWNYVSGVLRTSTDAVVGATTLLRSVAFPRLVLPIALVIFHLAQFLLSFAIFLPVGLWIYGWPSGPGPALAAFPLFLVLHSIFVVGIALVLATIAVRFRDVRHLIDAVLPMLFWATPVVYEMKLVPASVAVFVNLSPMAVYIRAYQDVFYYGVVPAPALWLAALLYAAAALVGGVRLFQAHEAHFAELV